MSKHKRDYFCRYCGCDLRTHDEQVARVCDSCDDARESNDLQTTRPLTVAAWQMEQHR